MTSKEEYLKRYLSDGAVDKKKKIHVQKPSRVRIFDDDIDVKQLIPKNIKNTIDEDIGADKPLVADFVDERPKDVIELEKFRKSKCWKIVGQSDGLSHKNSRSLDSRSVVGDARRRHDSDADQSSTRKRSTRHDSDTDLSPARKHSNKHDSDTDLSPARKRSSRHDSDTDLSPARKRSTRHDSDTDLSSARKQSTRHDSDTDLSPARKRSTRHDSGTDLSSARKHSTRHDSDTDLSPERKRSTRHDSDTDLSPARKRSTRHDSDTDLSSTRKQSTRHDSDTDLSPARKRSTRRDSDTDLSPTRKRSANRHASDLSPARKRSEKFHDSPPTSQTSCDTNSKFSRKDLSPVRKSVSEQLGKSEKATKTLSGAKAGLQSASDMKTEARELKKREEQAFAKISDDLSGRNATTVLRDKATGRRRNLEEEQAKKSEEDAIKNVANAKYQEWNKGLKQKEMKETMIKDAIHEADKPLARYKDDADLDARLREQERAEDPMLAYMKKKKAKNSGPVKPRYVGAEPPPNRFNIWPGYRWDGVDRSNGFERQYFASLTNKKAIKDIAYKWSVEDM